MARLVLNAGSSSLKFALFEGERARSRGQVDGIGTRPVLRAAGNAQALDPGAGHEVALGAILAGLDAEITAVGHRIVHGGTLFTEPTLLDEAGIARLETLSALAPLHNPVGLAVVRAARAALPGAAQVACFDTAFHAAQPALATRFAIPEDARTEGLRRYGFHGLSYQGLVASIVPLPRRLLACHLGNGASLCAIRDGRSVATTMGWSPLDGLTMGTRSGSLDPAAALELARRLGIEAAERLLLRESGLLGLSGLSSDMRALRESGEPAAAFAIEHFTYWAARHAGSMVAAMGGIDAIAFTGGIGEHDAGVRGDICARLDWTGLRIRPGAEPDASGHFQAPRSPIRALVVPADEETVIDTALQALMSE